jgi:hypothetical protein
MSSYVFTSSGELTHCGDYVDWEDCNRHDAGCFVTVCRICGLRDSDCES